MGVIRLGGISEHIPDSHAVELFNMPAGYCSRQPENEATFDDKRLLWIPDGRRRKPYVLRNEQKAHL